MRDNYFKRLFFCILASFSLLVIASIFRWSPWISLVFGVTPLVYYHWFYLRVRAKKSLISQTAIDSVYYFGFLITVIALGVSAVMIAASGTATDINSVVFQFGVGLFATGYAVIARMHLSSLATQVEDASPEAIMDRYIKRSMDLLDTVELALVRTSEFSQTTMAMTSQVAESARESAERVMLDVAKTFGAEMTSSLALARQGISEIRGLVADTTFVVERQELAKTIKATIESSNNLNAALDQYAMKSRESIQVTQANIATSERLDGSLSRLELNISALAGSDGALVRSVDSVRVAGEAISSGASAIANAVGELESAAIAVADTGPTFQRMRTAAKKVNEQLDTLSGVTERFDEVLNGFSSTAESGSLLAGEFERMGKVLPQLITSTDGLAERLDRLNTASERVEVQFNGLPAQAAQVQAISIDLASALRDIVSRIEEASIHAQALKSNTEDSVKVVDGAKSLLASAFNLEATVGSLQERLNGLGQVALVSQNHLESASTALRSSMSATAKLLENDVRRSSESAALLTDRLVEVAQTIIDRTRAQQGVAN